MFKKSLISLSLAVLATGSFAQVYVEGAFGSGNINQEYANATSSSKSSAGNKFAIGYEISKDWSA